MSPKLLSTVEAQMYVTQLNVTSLLDEVEIVAPNEFATIDPDEYDRDPRVRRMWHLPGGANRQLD